MPGTSYMVDFTLKGQNLENMIKSERWIAWTIQR